MAHAPTLSYFILKSSEALNGVLSLSVASQALSMFRRSPALKGETPGGTRASSDGDVKFSRLALIAILANIKVPFQPSHCSDEFQIREYLYSPELMSLKLANCSSSPRRQTERRNPERNRKSRLWVGNLPSLCALLRLSP